MIDFDRDGRGTFLKKKQLETTTTNGYSSYCHWTRAERGRETFKARESLPFPMAWRVGRPVPDPWCKCSTWPRCWWLCQRRNTSTGTVSTLPRQVSAYWSVSAVAFAAPSTRNRSPIFPRNSWIHFFL